MRTAKRCAIWPDIVVTISASPGYTSGRLAGENIPVANLQEVYPGEAEIVTTISGQMAQRFAVRIERVNMTASDMFLWHSHHDFLSFFQDFPVFSHLVF